MASLLNTLTASKGAEQAGFLNDIVEQLWPNIGAASAKIAKDVVEPILASTLPGPLSGLRFVKFDLGHIPLKVSNIDVHKTKHQGIKLDMDVDWEGVCDIELAGGPVPKVGVEKVHLHGRLSILLCPLINVIPLIGAAQVAFINPPSLELDFTNAANIADLSIIRSTVRKVILNIISSMAVLPNRFLVKLDPQNDYFKTYQHELGILRLTVSHATGIIVAKKTGITSGVSKLLSKVVKDVPDCYVNVKVGAGEEFRTATQNNTHDPKWNETHDFLVTDFDQVITADIQDDDLGSDDDIGLASITVKDILLNGGTQELSLMHKGQSVAGKLTLHAQFLNFVTDPNLAPSPAAAAAPHTDGSKTRICGLVTILIAGASGLSGKQDQLKPSVKVTWGDKKFQTAVKTYSPGTDIFNPAFDQAFKVPLTSGMVANPAAVPSFRFTVLNDKAEVGSAEVSFRDVVSAPAMTKQGVFDVGGGVKVTAGVDVHWVKLA